MSVSWTTWAKGDFASCLCSKIVISSQVRAADAMATTIRTAIGTHLLRGPVRVTGPSSGSSSLVAPVVSAASVLMPHHLLWPTPS